MAWGKEGRKKVLRQTHTPARLISTATGRRFPSCRATGKPLLPAPTTPAPLKTGRGAAATSRARPHCMATLPLDHARPEKRATPLSPPLFRYAPQLRSQRRNTAGRVGSRLHAEEGRIASTGMLPKLTALTGLASPNRIGGAHGGEDQHGCTARGAGGGGRALPVSGAA